MDTPPLPPVINVGSLARAIRFALVCILLGLCYLNLRCALSINAFAWIYSEKCLGALPPSIEFILKYRILLISLSVILPFCAVLILFSGQVIRSFYALGLLALLTLVELVTLYFGLFSEFKLIIQSMPGHQM